MKNPNKLFLWAAAGILLAGCKSDKAADARSREYRTQVIAPVSRTLASTYSATIRGRQDIDIYPQVSGSITRLLVEEGQAVAKNQVLFIIDQVPYRAAVHRAEANVKAARAAVSTARLTYEGRKALFAKNIVSNVDFRTSENDLETAEAQLALSEAELEDAQNNLSYTEVKSPADGVVGVLPFREGALVGPTMAQPLTTVSDNSTMYVYFSLTENRMLSMIREHGTKQDALERMPPVELQLNDGTAYREKGKIESLSGVIDRSTGTVSARAAFSNAEGLLHSGGSGNVIIPVAYDNCIAIPRTATYEVQHLTYVYKIVDGTAHSTVVEVERANGEEFIVHSGLQYGDTIAAEGAGTLRDGMSIISKN